MSGAGASAGERASLVSLDLETDGPFTDDERGYSILSIGATEIYGQRRTFYAELRPISALFIPEAVSVSGLDRGRLEREGRDPADAMRAFCAWARALGPQPVLASFSTWDLGLIWWYLCRFVGREALPFSHSHIDMKSMLYGALGVDWSGTGKSRLKKTHPELLRGLPPHSHNALEDALEQAELFRRIRALAGSGR